MMLQISRAIVKLTRMPPLLPIGDAMHALRIQTNSTLSKEMQQIRPSMFASPNPTTKKEGLFSDASRLDLFQLTEISRLQTLTLDVQTAKTV